MCVCEIERWRERVAVRVTEIVKRMLESKWRSWLNIVVKGRREEK